MNQPLVLLHGFTGGPESWDEVVNRLASSQRSGIVVRETLLGHGAPKFDLAESFAGEVDRLVKNVASRGLRGVHLVGYSLGARVALGMLAAHPSHFARATLIGVHPGIADEGERAARAAADEKWATLVETEGVEAFVDRWEAQPIFASQSSLPIELRDRQRRLRSRHRPAGLALALRALGLGRMPDHHPVLGAITMPIHLVVGERDLKFRKLAESMLAAMQHATLEVASEAGHNVVLERPSVVAAALLCTTHNHILEARSS